MTVAEALEWLGKSRHNGAERLEMIMRDHEKMLRDHGRSLESEKPRCFVFCFFFFVFFLFVCLFSIETDILGGTFRVRHCGKS